MQSFGSPGVRELRCLLFYAADACLRGHSRWLGCAECKSAGACTVCQLPLRFPMLEGNDSKIMTATDFGTVRRLNPAQRPLPKRTGTFCHEVRKYFRDNAFLTLLKI